MESLADVLRARIDQDGPMTFAEFMDSALYHPALGFYARPSVGEQGHFVTSPHLSPVFGILLARQVEDIWELLGRPDPFAVVEAGAGDGTLARQILDALPEPVREAIRYEAVERSDGARTALTASGIDAFSDLDEVPKGRAGFVLANELLDNLPFHRVRATEDGMVELYVDRKEEGFLLVEGPLSDPALASDVPSLAPGAEWVARPEAPRFLDRAVALLDRGYVWTADYAIHASTDGTVSVHGYRGQRLDEDVLEGPGSKDITAGVDFEALRRHAQAATLPVWGPVSQREALLALGFREVDRRAQARQQEAIAARRGIDALRIYSNRTRANQLVAKEGLGDFEVFCVGVRTDAPPLSVRASVW